MMRCTGCGRYLLGAECTCGSPARTAHPPKFSLHDKYAKYRRMAKKSG
jgi:rRNA maturation protein Nop10